MRRRKTITTESKVFTDRLRELFKNLLNPVAVFLVKKGFSPDLISLFGLVGHAGAAYLIATGRFTWAGILILVFAPLDALDGTMARFLNRPGKFGAFFDSVVDRYSELLLFGGMVVYYGLSRDFTGTILAYLSLMGSVMVSYSRARAEALGFTAKIGLLSRVERYIILIPALIFRLLPVGLWILAFLTNFTALQRVIAVKRQASILATSGPISPEKT